MRCSLKQPCVVTTPTKLPTTTGRPRAETLNSLRFDEYELHSSRIRRKRQILNLRPHQAVADKVAETAPTTHNWFKQWWPSYSVRDLHTDRPNRIQLLGEYFVVWKSAEGDWIVMKDICPHRLAPLSEGRIEDDGTIMCSYHGWRFDTCGNCVKIPQADDTKSHDAACKNQRSAAKTYPCRAAANLLWIWPDDAPDAFAESSTTSLSFPEDVVAAIERLGERAEISLVVKELPYAFDVMMENLIDPSHVPFSHHGVVATRETACPLQMRIAEDTLFPDSIVSMEYKPDTITPTSRLEVLNAGTVCYQSAGFNKEHGTGFLSFFLATPMNHVRTRHFAIFVSAKAFNPTHSIPLPFTWKMFPWLFHEQSYRVHDGDTVFLHAQQKVLENLDNGWTNTTYYTPTSADRMINTYRRWLVMKGGGGPKMQGQIAEPHLTRDQLLDRHECHVNFCNICQSAIRFLTRAKATCEVIRNCALVAATCLALYSYRKITPWWTVALSLIPVTLFTWIVHVIQTKQLPKFYFEDYVHQEKN